MLKAKRKIKKKEIKQDKFVTYYFKTLDFYNQYKKEVHYGLIGLVAVFILGFYLVNSKKEAEQKAAVELARAKAAFVNENYDVAIDILTALTENFSSTRSAGVGTILLAKAHFAKKDYEQAEIYFRKYLDDYDDDPILALAAAEGIAATYDERGDYAKAAELYEKAANRFKDSFKAPELLLAAGRCYKLAGNTQDARRVFEELVKNYEKSQVVNDAKMYLAELR